MRKPQYLSLFLLLAPLLLHAQINPQNIIATAGGTLKNNSFTLSWTLGEVVISSLESKDWMLTQGFHQGNLTVLAVDNIPLSNFAAKLFPNPAIDCIQVEIETTETGKFRVEMIDAIGQVVQNSEFDSQSFKINLKGLAQGIYYLRVRDKNAKPLGIYKIIKRAY